MSQNNQRGSQSKISASWAKQGLQIPKAQSDKFRDNAAEFGSGGVKVLGTIGIAFVNAMPPEVRVELADYVNSATWRSPDGLKDDVFWKFLLHLLAVHGVQLPEITHIKAVEKHETEQESEDK